jgi:hypothetical protein
MIRAMKVALAVILCVIMLLPAAWARSKDFGDKNPNGDGTGDNSVASTSEELIIVAWISFGGIAIPGVSVVSITHESSTVSDVSIQDPRVEDEEDR